MHPRHHPFARAAIGLSVLLAVSLSGTAATAAIDPAVEIERRQSLKKFALKLLNCNRTGSKIRRNGTCRAPRTGRFSAYRRPLKRHRPIGNEVAWPWARTLVLENQCRHELDGHPGLAPRDMVIWVSRAFQREKAEGGGHWRNLKSRSFKSVGIAIAVSETRATIIFDFFGKRP